MLWNSKCPAYELLKGLLAYTKAVYTIVRKVSGSVFSTFT